VKDDVMGRTFGKHGEMRNAFRILAGKPEAEKLLERLSSSITNFIHSLRRLYYTVSLIYSMDFPEFLLGQESRSVSEINGHERERGV
jgi:hypothetical protein